MTKVTNHYEVWGFKHTETYLELEGDEFENREIAGQIYDAIAGGDEVEGEFRAVFANYERFSDDTFDVAVTDYADLVVEDILRNWDSLADCRDEILYFVENLGGRFNCEGLNELQALLEPYKGEE